MTDTLPSLTETVDGSAVVQASLRDLWFEDADALGRHQALNATLVGEVARRAELAGVRYVYYQAVTLGARVIAKMVPVEHLHRAALSGVRFYGGALADQHTDIHGNLLGGGAEAKEFIGIPDLSTFAVLPWDPQVARVLCAAYHPAERAGIGGRPVATDSRSMLIHSHAAFRSSTGLELRSGCEPEMVWVGPGLEVHVAPGSAASYANENLEIMRPIFKRVVEYATAFGLEMIEGDYEDPGQLELNFRFDRAELTADRLVTYRQVCKQVAREFGVKASFMAKPANGTMGNGCHHNLSLWRGEDNVFDDGRTELHLSELGHHALGGILAHARGAMAVMASTVNSYKRFWDLGMFAPSFVNWGHDNRTCAVRLSSIGRLEFKVPDASVNPYLSHTVLLAAMADGLERRLDPGLPQEGATAAGTTQAEQLPLTLGDALEVFRRDPVVWGSLPAEAAEAYSAVKADEWARFIGAVTEWDRDMYFDAIP